jgi:hypothetical protein
MIDSLADPQPDKAKAMTTRIRGANLLGTEPPKSKKLNNKIHMWQIRSNLLEKNLHWVSTGQITTKIGLTHTHPVVMHVTLPNIVSIPLIGGPVISTLFAKNLISLA